MGTTDSLVYLNAGDYVADSPDQGKNLRNNPPTGKRLHNAHSILPNGSAGMRKPLPTEKPGGLFGAEKNQAFTGERRRTMRQTAPSAIMPMTHVLVSGTATTGGAEIVVPSM